MRSSFTSRAPTAADAGTRPGLHGQTLVSMGLADLDRLLGGGLPLGSLLLVTEDAHSRQHLNFMKYFMAEGVTLGQKVAWLTAQPPRGGPGQFLPAEASAASSREGKEQEEEEGQEAEKDDGELKIAWQYRKYIQQQQQQWAAPKGGAPSPSGPGAPGARRPAMSAAEAGIARVWCRTYDLTKAMDDAPLVGARLECHDCRSASASASGGDSSSGGSGGGGSAFGSSMQLALVHAAAFLEGLRPPADAAPSGALAARGPESVGRLVVQSLGSPLWWQRGGGFAEEGEEGDDGAAGGGGEGGAQQARQEALLVRAVLQLRQMVQDTRATALVTVPASLLTRSAAARLAHAADAVLSLSPMSDDSEVFALLPDAPSAVALLCAPKLPSAGRMSPRMPDPNVYVVRNKRRRLAITVVDVDPDAEARQAAAAAQQQPHSGGLEF